MTPQDAIDAVLEIKRGRRKLADFDGDDRRAVFRALQTTTDAQLATAAREQEQPRGHAGFHFARHMQ